MRKQIFFGHFLTLIFGILIYLFFRLPTLKVFKWLENIGLDFLNSKIRIFFYQFSNRLPEWILYSLPDGLWIFSYVTLILAIWENQITRESFFWITLIPFVAISSEIGQIYKIIPGTFDILDLFFYLAGSLTPIFIYYRNSKLKYLSI